MIGINVPMKATDISNHHMITKVQRIENPTTKKGRKTPVQLLKKIIKSKIPNPRAMGVKTRKSRCIYSITVALVMGRLET